MIAGETYTVSFDAWDNFNSPHVTPDYIACYLFSAPMPPVAPSGYWDTYAYKYPGNLLDVLGPNTWTGSFQLQIPVDLPPGSYELTILSWAGTHDWGTHTPVDILPPQASTDTTSPTLSSIVPADGTMDADTSTSVQATFSEAMNQEATQNAFSLSDGGTSVSGTFAWSGDTMTFTPSSALQDGKTYSVSIGTGATDAAGNAMTSAFTSSFTTKAAADATAPVISDASPTSPLTLHTTGTSVTQTFTASYSDDSGTVASATVTLDGTDVSSDWGVTTSSLSHDASLATGTHTVELTVKDAAGNEAKQTWNVEVIQDTVPTVSSVSPAGGSSDVDTATTIQVTFSEAMDHASTEGAFSLSGGTSVAGAFTWTGDTMTFTPSSLLSDKTEYTVTIGTGAKGQVGVPMASEFTSSFQTKAAANTAPSITAITVPTTPAAVNTQATTSATFSDPDSGDMHTATWDWGDGSTSAGTVDENAKTVGGSHSYSTPGIYIVSTTLTDSKGASDSKTATTYIVVYDPAGGFVTGGGWINSPAGAYKTDSSMAGRANFGFNAKYLKGANTPIGQTEFNFQVADLNFHSSSYQWLVVNQGGTNAQFKGDGTINGANAPNGQAYKFMLWAGDHNPDTFRIKIWYEDGGEHVVYDNGVQQAIAGGSIVVHAK